MANNLGHVLKNQGRTQIWLTKALLDKGIKRDLTTINRWCKGHHSPRDNFVREAMAEVLSVSHDELFPDAIEKPPFEEEVQPITEPAVQVQEIVQPEPKVEEPTKNGGPVFNEDVSPAEQKQEEDNTPEAQQGDGDFKPV